MYSAQMMSQITPLEIDILFLLCDLLHQTGKVMYSDFQEIAPEQYMKQVKCMFIILTLKYHSMSMTGNKKTY